MAVPPPDEDAPVPAPGAADAPFGSRPLLHVCCALYLSLMGLTLRDYVVHDREVLLSVFVMLACVPFLLPVVFLRLRPAVLRSGKPPVRSRAMEGLFLVLLVAAQGLFLPVLAWDLSSGALPWPLLVFHLAALVPLSLGVEAYVRDWWWKR